MSLGPVFKHAGYVQISRELAADARSLQDAVFDALDRRFFPWRYPDPNPFPRMDLFPRVSRVLRHVCRLIDRFTDHEDDDEDDW